MAFSPHPLQRTLDAEVHGRMPRVLVYSHDSQLVATGSGNDSITIWDASYQIITRKWDAHTGSVCALAFSPDDTRIASGGADGSLTVWSVESAECLQVVHAHNAQVRAVAWSADGRWIATGSNDTRVCLWDMETFKAAASIPGHGGGITFVRFSPDGRWLAFGGADLYVHIWDVPANAPHLALAHSSVVWVADFDADGARIATCCWDGSTQVRDVQTGKTLIVLDEHWQSARGVAFSKDGGCVLAAFGDGTMALQDSLTGWRKLKLTGHTGAVNAVTFSADTKYVTASASADRTVCVWRIADGSCMATFDAHDNIVTPVAFSPNGDTLSYAMADGTVCIWLANEWGPDRVG